jgi:surface carbohydrate biosynthesis protein
LNRKVALLVDNPLRDLPGLVLVAIELRNLGLEPYLVPMNLRESEIWELKPRFVLLNHFRTIYDDFVKKMKAASILVGVLDTEGSVFSPVPKDAHENPAFGEVIHPYDEYAISMSKDTDLRHSIDLYCAWSVPFAEHVVKRGWYKENQVKVTGPPRMDFYHSNFREYTKSQLQKISSRFVEQPYNLIAASFTLANPKFVTPQKEAELLIKNFKYRHGFVEDWLKTQQTAQTELILLTRELAERLPDQMFVFRPHPFEKLETYTDAFAEIGNIEVNNSGTADCWITNCNALIHWGSSTAIEAAASEKAAISGSWIPKHLPIREVERVTKYCHNISEIETLLRAVSPPTDWASIRETIESCFFKTDGQGSKRVASSIAFAVEKSSSDGVSLKKSNMYLKQRQPHPHEKIVINRLGQSFINALSSFLVTDMPIAWDTTDKSFNVAELEQILDGLTLDHPVVLSKTRAPTSRSIFFQ